MKSVQSMRKEVREQEAVLQGIGNCRGVKRLVATMLGVMLLLCVSLVPLSWADSGTNLSRERAVELCNIANVDWTEGNAQGALDKFKAAEKIFQARASENSTDVQAQRDLAVLNERMADVYVSLNKGAIALAAYRRCIEIDEQLSKADPENTWLLHHLSMVSLKNGDLYVWLANAEKAAGVYNQSLGYCEKLSVLDPGNMDAQLTVCLIRHRQGWLLQRLGLSDQAAQARQMELAAREDILSSSSTKDEEALFYAYKHLGEQYQLVGQRPDSIAVFQESLGLAKRLIQDYPENIQYRWELSSVFRNLGQLHAQQGEWDASLSAYNEVLLLGQQMAEVDKENRASHQRDVMVTHYKLGKIFEAKEESAAALQEYKTALALAESFASGDAGDKQLQRDVNEIKKEIAKFE